MTKNGANKNCEESVLLDKKLNSLENKKITIKEKDDNNLNKLEDLFSKLDFKDNIKNDQEDSLNDTPHEHQISCLENDINKITLSSDSSNESEEENDGEENYMPRGPVTGFNHNSRFSPIHHPNLHRIEEQNNYNGSYIFDVVDFQNIEGNVNFNSNDDFNFQKSDDLDIINIINAVNDTNKSEANATPEAELAKLPSALECGNYGFQDQEDSLNDTPHEQQISCLENDINKITLSSDSSNESEEENDGEENYLPRGPVTGFNHNPRFSPIHHPNLHTIHERHNHSEEQNNYNGSYTFDVIDFNYQMNKGGNSRNGQYFSNNFGLPSYHQSNGFQNNFGINEVCEVLQRRYGSEHCNVCHNALDLQWLNASQCTLGEC